MSITRSQVSDFTSGSVAYATSAGSASTAGAASTAGTASYATTSGTAVSISGSITQSQVTNLTTALDAKAPLASPSFTGTVGIQTANINNLNVANQVSESIILGNQTISAIRSGLIVKANANTEESFNVAEFLKQGDTTPTSYFDSDAKLYIPITSSTPESVANALTAKSPLTSISQFAPWVSGAYYKPPIASGTLAGATAGSNAMFLTPIYIPNSITLTSLTTYCTAYTSGTPSIRMGVYNDVNGIPSGSPLVDAGAVTVNATGPFTITISKAVTAGRYWLAWVAQTTTFTATFHGNNGVTTPTWTTQSNGIGAAYAQNMISYRQTGVSGALPSIGTLTAVNIAAIPHVGT